MPCEIVLRDKEAEKSWKIFKDFSSGTRVLSYNVEEIRQGRQETIVAEAEPLNQTKTRIHSAYTLEAGT